MKAFFQALSGVNAVRLSEVRKCRAPPTAAARCPCSVYRSLGCRSFLCNLNCQTIHSRC